MKSLFYKAPQNIAKIFSGYNLLWHLLAFALTYIIVRTGLDWRWWLAFRHFPLYEWFMLGAGLLGFVLPILVPLGFLVVGKLRRNARLVNVAWAMGQAGGLAWLIAAFYKVFTGRPGPEIIAGVAGADISQVFRFGIWRGGIFWGWPSSHTMIAFAGSVCLAVLFRDNKKVGVAAMLYACFIAFGAGISFHWLSDVVAAAIIGTVIGLVVGRIYQDRP